jgi:hypothetical protein
MILRVSRRYVLALLLVPTLLFAFNDGDGSAGDPFQITTAAQLDSVRYYCGIEDSGKYFMLMNDIDLTNWLSPGSPGYDSGAFWRPIGDSVNTFYGKCDGNNFKILGLKINRPDSMYIGLFGYIGVDAVIQNIGVEIINRDSVKGRINVGGLVGYNYYGTVHSSYAIGAVSGSSCIGGFIGKNFGNVNNSYATGAVSGSGVIGGLVGDNTFGILNNCHATGTASGSGNIGGLAGNNSGTVNNCYATDAVSGTYNVGGLVGYNFNSNGIVKNSYATGEVIGTFHVGGLVGENANSPVDNCHAAGTVSGTNYVGGLLGYNRRGKVSNSHATGTVHENEAVSGGHIGGLIGKIDTGTVIGSYATGAVSGTQYVGGLVGDGYLGTLSNCYAAGMVTGNNSVGGLIGENQNWKVSNCYAVGVVSGSTWVGGLVGSNGGVSSSYWDKQTTGQDTSAGSDPSYGRTTTEMKTQSTFEGWDFDTTWAIASDKNNGYPYLQWQFLATKVISERPGNDTYYYCRRINNNLFKVYYPSNTSSMLAKVFTMTGREINHVAWIEHPGWNDCTIKIDKDALSPGTYILNLRNRNRMYNVRFTY